MGWHSVSREDNALRSKVCGLREGRARHDHCPALQHTEGRTLYLFGTGRPGQWLLGGCLFAPFRSLFRLSQEYSWCCDVVLWFREKERERERARLRRNLRAGYLFSSFVSLAFVNGCIM